MNDPRQHDRACWLCALLLPVLGVLPAAADERTNALPQAESFETYADGTAITQAPGWFLGALADAATGRVTTNPAAIAALAVYTNGGGALPLDTTHAKVLALRGRVAQRVSGPAGRLVRTDCLLLPLPRENPPPPNPAMQVGLCFDTNGQAVILHRNTLAGTNEWLPLALAPPVASQSWVRVTVLQDYASHMYQLRLNDGPAIADNLGWSGPPPGGSRPGTWFFMPNTNGVMAEVFCDGDGEAYLDDLEIATDLADVQTLPASNVTATAADLVGYLSFTGLAQTAVEVYWGATDGGTNAEAWAHTNRWDAPQAPGRFAHTAPVATNTLVYYRYAAANAFGRAWAGNSEAVVVDPVTVTVPILSAVPFERPTSTGIFRLMRPAGTAGAALTVHCALSGAAANGVDYGLLPDSVVMQPGATNVDIVLTTIPDGVTEGNEEAVLTLLPGSYLVGSPAAGGVTIQDTPPMTLTWDNTSRDGCWNSTSTNWLGQDGRFQPNDAVIFPNNADATGRIYVGTAPGSPMDVTASTLTVKGTQYEFEGGSVRGGPVVIQGGRVIDRELTHAEFGSGTLTLLNGGEFWRQVPPDGTARTQVFSNAFSVAGTGTLQGGRGTNEWRGAVELKARLYIGATNVVISHVNRFTGALTVNRDTNSTAARVVSLRAGGGQAYLDGPIVDDPDQNHGGVFPLVLETAAGAAFLTVRGSNTYTCGTVITNAGSTSGVVVAAGASLGRGLVTVTGSGARLLVQGAGAIVAPLAVASNATVTLAADGAVSGADSTVTVAGGGLLVLQSGDCLPNAGVLSLDVAGQVQTGSNLVETVGDLFIGGQRQQGGLYTRAEKPANILGYGAIQVKGPAATGLILLVR